MYMESRAGTCPGRHSPLVEGHRKYFHKLACFSESSFPAAANATGFRWEVNPGFGNGFSEILRLDHGPELGRCGFRTTMPLSGDYLDTGSSLRFCTLISGSFTIASQDGQQTHTVNSGDVWCYRGGHQALRCIQPAHTFISGVVVDIPQAMVQAWLGTAPCHLSSGIEQLVRTRPNITCSFLQDTVLKARALPGDHPIMKVSRKLYMAQRSTICDRLRLESLALDYLSRVLAPAHSPTRHPINNSPLRQQAIAEALSILDEEWTSPPTIAALSRRVGVNECYLKTDFRERTGMSIGAYVRKLRMEQARGLIESGRFTVLQAASFVGYSNPSHFSQAFKRYHGRLPSTCIPSA